MREDVWRGAGHLFSGRRNMLKRLISHAGEYRKSSVWAGVLVALEVVMEVLIPLLMAKLIDNGIEKGNMPYVWKMGLVLFGAAFLSLLFGVGAGTFAAKASAGFAKNLRKAVYENVQTFSFSNIDRFSPAGIVTRLTTDITNVQNAYQIVVRTAVRAPFMLVFSLVCSFRVDAGLSMIFVAVIPFLGAVLYGVIMAVHPLFVKVFDTYDRLNNIVGENLHGIRVVKSFVREDYEKEKFRNISGDIYRDFTKAEKLIALDMPAMQLAVFVCLILLSWFGAKTVVESGGDALTGLSTGELMSLVMYSMQILMSLMLLAMVLVMIIISRTSGERISEILDEKPDQDSNPDGLTDVPDGSITFSNVTFYYDPNGEKPCLSNIDLSIKSGESVGIIGGTGSSKSTLVSLLPRLYDATEGSVMIGGHDVKEYNIEALRAQVAVVLQQNILFSGTIKENIRWGKEDADDAEIEEVCRLACAHEFISDFPAGYDTYIEQGGTNVSGGQRQRLCIARALIKKPKILILDDSTSAVDTKTEASIWEALTGSLSRTTKLIIAQRISSVQRCDRIIVMDDGKVNGFGTHEELLEQNRIYREIYESQQSKGVES